MTPRARLGAAVGAAGLQSQLKWDEQPSTRPASAAPSLKTASRLQAKAVVPLDAPVKAQEVELSLAERAPRLKAKKAQQARNSERGKQVALKSEPALEVAATVADVTAAELEASQLPPAQPEPATANTQCTPCQVEPPVCNGFSLDSSLLSRVVAPSDGRPHNRPEASSCPESSVVCDAVAAQEEVEEPLEIPPAELSDEVANDSRKERDDKNCNEDEWNGDSPGRFRVLKVRADRCIFVDSL